MEVFAQCVYPERTKTLQALQRVTHAQQIPIRPRAAPATQTASAILDLPVSMEEAVRNVWLESSRSNLAMRRVQCAVWVNTPHWLVLRQMSALPALQTLTHQKPVMNKLTAFATLDPPE